MKNAILTTSGVTFAVITLVIIICIAVAGIFAIYYIIKRAAIMIRIMEQKNEEKIIALKAAELTRRMKNEIETYKSINSNDIIANKLASLNTSYSFTFKYKEFKTFGHNNKSFCEDVFDKICLNLSTEYNINYHYFGDKYYESKITVVF